MSDDWMLANYTVEFRDEERRAWAERDDPEPPDPAEYRDPIDGQLSLEDDPEDEPDDRYDPSTADIPY